ncbi:MAG: DUF692 domain-containing protein [Planctomycetes bacterium]|nr:DUF692 domain-containing protein [Planctomycetota bacterium]
MSPATHKNLGIGIGLRIPHYEYIFSQWPEIDFFEIISENFMVAGGPPLRNLDRILERYPVVQHGVSLGIASALNLDFEYLRKLKVLCQRTQTPWFSDHLCWSQTGNAHLHDLLPLPYTEENGRYIIEKAKIIQDYIGLPFALENLSSYVSFKESEMSEWDFYRMIVEESDCYMMLDMNNIYVSAMNHGFDPQDYLDAIPWKRVIQCHVAGHSEQDNGTLLDTHDHQVKEQVWQLYQQMYEKTQGVSTVLEWDANFLSFSDTHDEALKARQYQGTVYNG